MNTIADYVSQKDEIKQLKKELALISGLHSKEVLRLRKMVERKNREIKKLKGKK